MDRRGAERFITAFWWQPRSSAGAFTVQGLTTQHFYDRKHGGFLKIYEQQQKQRQEAEGFAPPHVIALSSAGPLFTSLVIEGLNRDQITASDVSDYLQIRVQKAPQEPPRRIFERDVKRISCRSAWTQVGCSTRGSGITHHGSSPTVWAHMEVAAKQEEILIIDEVADELARKDDGIFKWVKNHEHIVVPIDENIQQILASIMKAHPVSSTPRKIGLVVTLGS